MAYLTGIPLWVYILFFYLLYVGIKSFKPSTSNVRKLLIIPLVFIIMGVDRISGIMQHNFGSVPIWILSIGIGIVAGYYLVRNVPIKVNREKQEISYPGGPALLILVMSIFFVKFAIGFIEGIGASYARDAWFLFTSVGISGFITGMTIGRAATYYHRYRKAS